VRDKADCRVCRALYARAVTEPAERVRFAAAATAGKGPPLAVADLLDVIDLLGASATEPAKKALNRLAKDKRPDIARAVQQAVKDQANPDARAARKAKEEKPTEAPGTVPVPAGATGDHQH